MKRKCLGFLSNHINALLGRELPDKNSMTETQELTMRVATGFRFEPSGSEILPFLSLESGGVGVSIRCGYMARDSQEGTSGYRCYWRRQAGSVAHEPVFLLCFLSHMEA